MTRFYCFVVTLLTLLVTHSMMASEQDRQKLEMEKSADAVRQPATMGTVATIQRSALAFAIDENFEGAWPPSGWVINNPDAGVTWNQDLLRSGYGVGSKSAWMDFYSYSPASAQKDSLLSPVVTGLAATDSLIFDYAYCKYSASFGPDTVNVYISTDGGASFSLVEQLSVEDSTTTAHASDWFPAANEWGTKRFPLPAGVVGNSVQLLFESINDFGQNFLLDNVKLGSPSALDIGATLLMSPGTGGCFGTNQTVTIRIQNLGGSTIDFGTNSVTVHSSVAGPNPQSFSPVVLSSGTITAGSTQDVVITTTYDMSAAGTYTFSANTSMTGDGNVNNDTMAATNRTVVGSVALPQAVDFTGFTGANLTAVFPNWKEQAGVSPTGTTSSWLSQTGLGSVGNITARINLYTTTRNEWIMGPKVVPLVGTNLTFKAAVTNWNSTTAPDSMDNDDKVRVMVSTDCGGTWTSIYQMDSTSNLTTTLTQQTVPLGAYAGTPIILAFYATDGPVNDPADYDFHIDDIQIGDALADDIGATVIAEDAGPAPAEAIAPTQMSRSGNAVTLSMKGRPEKVFADGGAVSFDVVVKNFGTASQATYAVAWVIDGVGQTPVANTEALDPADEDTLTLVWGAPTAGDHTVRAWTVLGSDGNAANDSSNTVSFEVLGANVVFREIFNDTTGGVFPPAGWDTVNVDGGGLVAPWYQGYANVFAPKEGPGKAADNFNAANGFYIDDYLITPSVGGPAEGARYVAFRYLMYDGGPSGGSSDYFAVDDVRILAGSGPAEGTVDTLVFFAQSNPSIYPDSMEIRVSLTGTNPGDFTTLLDYINVPKGAWTKFSYPLPPAGGSVSTNVVTGWNIVSNPVTTVDDSVLQLFPTSLFEYGFRFVSGTGYDPEYEMANGVGYWAKFPGATSVSFSGTAITEDSIDVVAGWNLIGSISISVDTADITFHPPSIMLNKSFYSFPYGTGDPILVAGKGYWVKTSGAGKIRLAAGPSPAGKPATVSAPSPLGSLNELTIRDASGNVQTLRFGPSETIDVTQYELPPLPPAGAFDARFESVAGGYAVQVHGQETGGTFPIAIQSSAYPLSVEWNIASGIYELSDATGSRSITGTGRLEISNSAISRIVLKLTGTDELPTSFALLQNYPNPFNPSTTIKFAIPVESRVTVEIYNALGQRVQVLVNDARKAGYHEVEWNGTGDQGQLLGSGVYFLRFAATGSDGRNFDQSSKLMLLK